MVSVRINGEDAALKADGLGSIAEVIELIKASIDPEHMITNLNLNGKELAESDWSATTNQFDTVMLEVETGTPSEFVRVRLGMAWEIARSLFNEFRDARKAFQTGNMMAGNKKLINAVNTARAFFEWYGSMLNLVPEANRGSYNISPQVIEISEVCKRLCQQQLYQSWWAIGETLEKDLEPKLDALEDCCRKFASA